MARPAVNCDAPVAVAVMMKPTQQHAFPNNRKSRRPKRSELAPASRNPIALPVVYAGTYQYEEVGSPKAADSVPCNAAVVGTGQNERPKVDDRTCEHQNLRYGANLEWQMGYVQRSQTRSSR